MTTFLLVAIASLMGGMVAGVALLYGAYIIYQNHIYEESTDEKS
jgi:hypothetical protein